MRPWIIALALAAGAGAQIRIVDTLYRPDGSRAAGSLAFSCGQMVSGGKYVVRDAFTYRVVNGAVDVTLFPGATCSVVYSTQQQPFSRTWVMPATAAAPLKIGDVEGSVPPSPRATFTASQITGGILTPERLGTGTPDASKVLRGDGVWVPGATTAPSYWTEFDVHSYNGGSVVFTNGSTAVTGIGTQWTPEMTGWEIMLPNRCGWAYRFQYVSPTSGTIEAPFACDSTVDPLLGEAHALIEPILVPGAAHQLGTADLAVQCFDGTSGVPITDVVAVAIAPATFNAKVLLLGAAKGRCILWR